jgi:hypothetical protein
MQCSRAFRTVKRAVGNSPGSPVTRLGQKMVDEKVSDMPDFRSKLETLSAAASLPRDVIRLLYAFQKSTVFEKVTKDWEIVAKDNVFATNARS